MFNILQSAWNTKCTNKLCRAIKRLGVIARRAPARRSNPEKIMGWIASSLSLLAMTPRFMLNSSICLVYELKSYFVPTPNPYVRTGECLKCGKCCNHVYSIDTYTEKEFKIMQFFYAPYRKFYIKGKDSEGNFIFACKCVSEDGLCTIYNKRPNFCRTFPVAKHNRSLTLPDGCGFKFVKKEFKEYLD